jgi:hypothetical protein
MATRKTAKKPAREPHQDRQGPAPKWATVERKPRNKKVDAFITRYPKNTQEACARIRAIVHEEVEDVEEAIYWGVPFFFRHTPMCYISPSKKHVTLGFTMGGAFKVKSPLLKGTGRTTVLKANFHPGYPLPLDEIRAWVREAAAIDAKHAGQEC